jgi:ubiquinone/menaquinone biosynthesis C-methylase UbiE
MIDSGLDMQPFAPIRRNYDRLSRWYDLLEGGGERQVCRLALNLLDLRAGENLLEIGSGTGENLLRLAGQLPGACLVGLDLSFGMIRQAQRKKLRNKYDAIHLLEGNMVRLPFADDIFSTVLCCFSIEIIPTALLPVALEEIRRVMLPSARLCVAAMADEQTNGFMARLYRWSNCKFPRVVDCRPIALENLLNAAGFQPQDGQLFSLYGLPVRLILAQK